MASIIPGSSFQQLQKYEKTTEKKTKKEFKELKRS